MVRPGSGLVAALSTALLAVPACNPLGPKTCTVMGCGPTFTVLVAGVPADVSATVVATAPDGSSRTAPCVGAGSPCAAYIDNFAPVTASIRVTWNSRTADFDVRPTYATSYPNGRDCPPECVKTQVNVTVTP